MNEFLVCEDLRKTFDHASGPIHVLKGINLKVRKGERLAILGRSGTGKSTLLHILGTLDRPSTGRVLFQNQDLFHRSDDEISRFRNSHMGFVFQFHYLLPEFTALENIMMPAWIGGESGSSVEKRAYELLSVVGLSERAHHRTTELSGGEQQRVSLARAVMRKPEIVFTDELTGNLDSVTGHVVLDYLMRMNEEMGVTVISVTHQKETATRFYKSVVWMKDGYLVDQEPDES